MFENPKKTRDIICNTHNRLKGNNAWPDIGLSFSFERRERRPSYLIGQIQQEGSQSQQKIVNVLPACWPGGIFPYLNTGLNLLPRFTNKKGDARNGNRPFSY